MIEHPSYPVEPWTVRETELHLDKLAQSESVFALSNGHIGLRGNLDEGEPYGLPGTYLAGLFETRPLPYAEAGYGYPEDGQSVVNVTNGKLLRLLVEDEPFDIRYGVVDSHERVLDLRAGVLRRSVVWTSPTGRQVRISSTRLVSFTQRAVALIEYEVEAVDGEFPVVLQSELVANETIPVASRDPRAAAALAEPLVSEDYDGTGTRAVLVHRTRQSGLRMAAAIDHLIDGPDGTATHLGVYADVARMEIVANLAPGKPLRVIKAIAYGWSGTRSGPALRDQVAAALAAAQHTGFEGLLADQRAYLDEYWDRADVEIEGDAELQQAVRFALWHTLQAGARGEQRAIAAKGLTGPGYDGHTFWDTEMFVLPVLTYTAPHAAADALRWRYETLGLARERARDLGLKGAAFPWRTIQGQECSGYWPAGTAAFHINADIARGGRLAIGGATDDEEFERTTGAELLVETARLWRSLGHHDAAGKFRIDGVTGPDEYSGGRRQQHLHEPDGTAEPQRGGGDRRAQSAARVRARIDAEEAAGWRDAAARMTIPYNELLEVHEQAKGFTSHETMGLRGSGARAPYPLLLHYPYFDLYRKQVVKQADLVLALYVRARVHDSEKRRATSSTTSGSAYAIVTVCLLSVDRRGRGRPHGPCLRLFRGSGVDGPEDLEHNTRDGVHIASLAGIGSVAVAGFGGMRDHFGKLTFPTAPARRVDAPTVPVDVSGTGAAGRGRFRARPLPAAVRRAAELRAPRHRAHAHRRRGSRA